MMLTCSAFALNGCAALNVQTYSGARLPLDDVAKVRPLSVQTLSVDAIPMKEQCGGRLMKDCNVLLLPGSRFMRIQLMSLDGSGGAATYLQTSPRPGCTSPHRPIISS